MACAIPEITPAGFDAHPRPARTDRTIVHPPVRVLDGRRPAL